MSIMPEQTPSDPRDWPGPGVIGVYPVLVEHAEHHQNEGPNTTWFGGNHVGFDIKNTVRLDAKTAWFNSDDRERLYFPAPEGGFDPFAVDYIAPRRLRTSEHRLPCPSWWRDQVADYQAARMWVISVAVVDDDLTD
jgi:hypothetical protein